MIVNTVSRINKATLKYLKKKPKTGKEAIKQDG